MVKKLLIVLVILVISTPQVLAQTTPTSAPSPTTAQTLKDQMKTTRQDLRADIKSARQAFKDKISLIKDERKKMVVGKIDDHVASSNAKLTGKMTNALTRMTAILTSLKEKAAALKTGGKDTSVIDAAIAAAEAAVSNAQTQVTTQAGKTYTANISSDNLLRGAIGQMISQFRRDIVATHKAVNDAKQAVMKAVMELAKSKAQGDPAATNSAATNTQL